MDCQKGQKNITFLYLVTFWQFSQNKFLFMFYIQLLADDKWSTVKWWIWSTYERCGITLKVIFKVRNWYFRNGACYVSKKHIYRVIHGYIIFKFTLRPLTLDKGLGTLNRLYHKRCIVWSKFVWNTYTKSYMAFQFTLCNVNWLFAINDVFYDYSWLETLI